MQAQKEIPPDFASCKDKFLVQVKTMEAGEEVTQDTFKAAKGVKDTKIRVVLEGPPARPSPVPEVNEADEDASLRTAGGATPHTDGISSGTGVAASAGGLSAAAGDPASLSQENRALRAQLQQIMAERDNLRSKLDKASKGGAASAGVRSTSAGLSPLSLLPVLIVGLLAFLVGHYLQNVPVFSQLLGKK